jgi:hypothetical protein
MKGYGVKVFSSLLFLLVLDDVRKGREKLPPTISKNSNPFFPK